MAGTGRHLRYHLRYQIIPGENVERDARTLADFCRRHGVEEVVLFFAGEEWNNGLLSREEEDTWFETVKRAKKVLEEAGLTVSLNPWMTVLHTDRGRRFPKDRKFRPMVSPLGEESKACASFADPGWRGYIYELYGRFAKLGFRVIWVEDDFRYHNHAPLTWGGGFEPEMLERFSEKVGREVSREEVVENILKPGKPHPWRTKWMETWREVQLEVARGIAEAVERNSSGRTKLGLMSSNPSIHSTEGRDWKMLFRALSIGGEVAHRPHFAPYGESPGRDKTYSIMMLDLQRNLRPPRCEVAPEIENFPFTRWNKSDTQTWAEMALAMFYGSDALLLDLFPFTGNPADREPQIGELLDGSRPALEWISSKFHGDLKTCGVGIPWREDAQAYVRTRKGRSMEELDASSFGPGYLLLPYGVPVSSDPQKVNAVFGSLAWAFGDDKVHRMLSGGLMLDGESAEILCLRGFGRYIGVDFKGWAERKESKYSLEVVTSEEAGVEEGLYFSVNLLPRIAVIEPLEGAHMWSEVITPEREHIGACTVAFENELGGRVFTYAAPDPASLPRSYQRQTMTQRAVSFISKGNPSFPAVTGGAHLMPIHFVGDGRQFTVVFNGSPDAARPVVRMGGTTSGPSGATLLSPLKEPVEAEVEVVSEKDGVTVSSRTDVPYLGYLVLYQLSNGRPCLG